MKFGVPLGLFVWSLFHAAVASYVFVILAAIFVAYLFLIDIAGRPKADALLWTADEIRVLRDYHLALSFPNGARDLSCYLNGIRWSSVIWVPWLLCNRLWLPAGFFLVNFFTTASLSVRLDPFFFLAKAMGSGHYRFAQELSLLRQVQEKLISRINTTTVRAPVIEMNATEEEIRLMNEFMQQQAPLFGLDPRKMIRCVRRRK